MVEKGRCGQASGRRGRAIRQTQGAGGSGAWERWLGFFAKARPPGGEVHSMRHFRAQACYR
jgi:hypothetical protein